MMAKTSSAWALGAEPDDGMSQAGWDTGVLRAARVGPRSDGAVRSVGLGYRISYSVAGYT
jgi:hypothetical protein